VVSLVHYQGVDYQDPRFSDLPTALHCTDFVPGDLNNYTHVFSEWAHFTHSKKKGSLIWSSNNSLFIAKNVLEHRTDRGGHFVSVFISMSSNSPFFTFALPMHIKGQLISKYLFLYLQFSQKTNNNNSTWGIIVWKSNFFRTFFGRIEDT
jgi:hypothetical protein